MGDGKAFRVFFTLVFLLLLAVLFLAPVVDPKMRTLQTPFEIDIFGIYSTTLVTVTAIAVWLLRGLVKGSRGEPLTKLKKREQPYRVEEYLLEKDTRVVLGKVSFIAYHLLVLINDRLRYLILDPNKVEVRNSDRYDSVTTVRGRTYKYLLAIPPGREIFKSPAYDRRLGEGLISARSR